MLIVKSLVHRGVLIGKVAIVGQVGGASGDTGAKVDGQKVLGANLLCNSIAQKPQRESIKEETPAGIDAQGRGQQRPNTTLIHISH